MSAPADRDIGTALADLTGNRPWWPLVEPTPRWIRVRLGGELVADSRRALLHVQYGPSELPRSFLPTYFVPREDVRPGVLTDEQETDGLFTWTVRAGGRGVPQGAWSHRTASGPVAALAALVTFDLRKLDWFEEYER